MDTWRTKDIPTFDVPHLAGNSLSGQYLDVMEMSKDEPVIVYFWATWCAACKFVTPTVDWFSNHYQVIGVSLNSGSDERVRRYMAAKDYTFNNINDLRGEISKHWGI
ncbi:thioredoxin domain-containing protein, partial [Vibrio owensii]